MTIRLVLADDHKILMDSLKLLLEQEQDIKVEGMAGDGRAVLKLADSLRPDAVVMDIGMPGMNGIDATRRLVAEHPKIKVIALSSLAHKQYVLEMLNAGASAYLIKENASCELVHALRAVMKGQKYLCPEVAAAVVDNVGCHAMEPIPQLSPREREVLQLFAEGGSSPELGKRLFISPSTVDVHRRTIMSKLGLHSIAELTKYAVRQGITSG